MKYLIDIDETICFSPLVEEGESRDYSLAQPYRNIISHFNELYEDGHEIVYTTSRGQTSGKDWLLETKRQLKKWGAKFHNLVPKPSYDLFIDDKCINVSDYKKEKNIEKTVGLVASAFDLLHAGHILMLEDAKRVCDYLIVALHEDPSVERPEKNKPLQSLKERKIQLKGCKYVDQVFTYKTEKDLAALCCYLRPDVRILGSDCKERDYITGGVYCGAIYYHERNHDYSSSALRKRL